MMPTPEISVVIPCLNEEANVVAIARAVTSELMGLAVSYEIIFIDNCSTDGTVNLIKAMCATDERVKLIVNNKNYGQMRSPTYGIYQASGRAVVGMCCDLQDPPALLGAFIDRWRSGARIVLGVRQTERSSIFAKFLRGLGYAFYQRFGDYRVIPGATGFGLYDREVVDCLKRWRDPEPFFRGMLVETGYGLQTIAYDRPPRAAGYTKNNFETLLSFALSGLASSSKKLLRAPIYISFFSITLSIVTFLISIIMALLGGPVWRALLVAASTLAFGILCYFLGLMGEQIRLISEMSRNVPLVLERERVNFSAGTSAK
jgi:glycosyltransferase involved in cell wall biosynthesis